MPMYRRTDDLRIQELRPLVSPAILMEDLPITEEASDTVALAREQIADELWGRGDDRLLVVVALLDPRSGCGDGVRGALGPQAP